MKAKFIAIILLVVVTLVGCSGENKNEEAPSANNEVQDIKNLVNDYSVGNKNALKASITSTQLMITNADQSTEVHELPEEDFFVSIAPYINETHP